MPTTKSRQGPKAVLRKSDDGMEVKRSPQRIRARCSFVVLGGALAFALLNRYGQKMESRDEQLASTSNSTSPATMLSQVSPQQSVDSSTRPGNRQHDQKPLLLKRLQADPNDFEALLRLCDLYDRDLSTDHEESTADDVVSCHSAIIARLQASVSSLNGDAGMEYAMVSADRVLSLARGDETRLEFAIDGFTMALGNSTRCNEQPLLVPFGEFTASSCLRAWLKLGLALKQLNREPPLGVWSGPSRFAGGPPHLQLPHIRAHSSWKIQDVPWLASISAALRTVALTEWPYLQHKSATEQLLIASARGTWHSHTFLINNKWNDELCRLCPKLCQMLKTRPELMSKNAVLHDRTIKPPELIVNFHSLQPGARLLPHFGTHGRLIASLGINGCEGAELRVGNDLLHWSRDNFIVFDDSFEHEVMNRGDHARIVFSINFIHPDLMAS